jgi:hypothetical protein
MSKLSRSSKRNTFQRDKYIERCAETNEDLNEDYIKMFESIDFDKLSREEDPEWQKDNLEWDLRTTDWILAKTRESHVYAQNLYAAMCNNDFQRNEVMPLLKNQTWSCSWRYAGGIVADMRQEGDYIEWYCSGIRGDRIGDQEFADLTEDQQKYYLECQAYVGEGMVTDEIRQDLFRLGWLVIDNEDDNAV